MTWFRLLTLKAGHGECATATRSLVFPCTLLDFTSLLEACILTSPGLAMYFFTQLWACTFFTPTKLRYPRVIISSSCNAVTGASLLKAYINNLWTNAEDKTTETGTLRGKAAPRATV